MLSIRQYFATIGRRGGIRSRRVLDPAMARRMVQIREARRAAQRGLLVRSPASADTSAAAQAVQDAIWQRLSAEQKIAQVAQLSRMVDVLSIQGLRRRHPAATDQVIHEMRAELRLGRELSARVAGARRDPA